MPTYIYRCNDCDHQFETTQSIKADPLSECPECEKEALRKVINYAPGIAFKGSGFYVTDSRNENPASTSTPDKSDKSKESEPQKCPAAKDNEQCAACPKSGDK
ncbi:FmdB family zinc ribbon protein [Candidatus Margulisiibacteriota bacterium]